MVSVGRRSPGVRVSGMMRNKSKREAKIVPAVHGLREVKPDPEFEIGLAQFLKSQYSPDALLELYGRFAICRRHGCFRRPYAPGCLAGGCARIRTRNSSRTRGGFYALGNI
jgi:hypothetical protein